MTGLILKFGFFYGTFGLSVVKDWDTDAESDGVVPSVFHLLAEGEVASAGMVGTDTGCQADAGQISRFGDSDPQFRCLYTCLLYTSFKIAMYLDCNSSCCACSRLFFSVRSSTVFFIPALNCSLTSS